MQENNTQQPNSIAGPTGAALLAQAELVMGLLARPTEALLRHDFGERYFGGSGITGKLVLFVPLLWFAFKTLGEQGGELLGSFLLTSFAVCVYHHIVMWRRKRNGERWHSRYAGTPLLSYLLPLDPQTIRRWVEPAIGMTAASLVAPVSPPLAGWLMLTSACIGATETIAEARWRTMLLDAQDKEIEAKHYRAALDQKANPKATEGFVIPVGGMSKQQRSGLLSSLSRLYGEARDALQRPVAPVPTPPAQPFIRQAPPPGTALVCLRCQTRNIPNAIYCDHCGITLRVASG